MNSSMDIFDYVLLATSMALCDKQLGVIPVAISLMTSCMSGLSLLGSSAELYYQGPSYAFVALSMLLCGPITAYTILPVFYRMNELSLYKYLELRFGHLIKYIVSIIYILQMVFYNAIVLYLPAMALQAVIGIDRLYSIILIGSMCVIYSGIGGLKAVVWTDFFQAMLMYASIIVVGALGTYDAGGFGKVFEIAEEGGRLNLDGFFNFDLTTRHTLWAILVGSTIKHVYLVGVNQVQMQRALCLPTLKQSQLCFVVCSIFVALISLLSTYMGLVLYAAYQSCDPYLAGQIPRRDAVIVHYVARRLSKIPGLRGIFVAGIFSATLSTLSSFSNSMAALVLEDYIKPIMRFNGHKEFNVAKGTWLAKWLATGFGAVCVLMAYVIDKANLRLLQATTTMFGAIGVPFLACFALGIFTRFTNTTGIIAGLIVTLSMGSYIAIYQTFFTAALNPKMPVYFDDKCASVFNMTQPSSSLPPITDVFNESQSFHWPPSVEPFSIDQISYMALPLVQFLLTIVIASFVSIITGGWRQEVNEEYLVEMLHKKKRSIESTSPATIDNFRLKLSQSIEESNALERKRKLGIVNRGFLDDDICISHRNGKTTQA